MGVEGLQMGNTGIDLQPGLKSNMLSKFNFQLLREHRKCWKEKNGSEMMATERSRISCKTGVEMFFI